MNQTFSQDHGDTTPTCRHIAVLRRTQNFQQPLNTPEPNAGTLVSGRAFLGGRQRCHARKGRRFLSESSVFRVNEGRSSSLLIMLVPGSTHKCLTGQPTTHWLRLELALTGLDNYRVRHPKSDAGSSNPSRPPTRMGRKHENSATQHSWPASRTILCMLVHRHVVLQV